MRVGFICLFISLICFCAARLSSSVVEEVPYFVCSAGASISDMLAVTNLLSRIGVFSCGLSQVYLFPDRRPFLSISGPIAREKIGSTFPI